MKRRDFISLIGGAAAWWPLAARAQQTVMPLIRFLRTTSADDSAQLVEAFRQGLGEVGYVEGRNVAIEYRYAQDDVNRLPALVADLVGLQVTVLAATGGTTIRSARAWSLALANQVAMLPALLPLSCSSGLNASICFVTNAPTRPGLACQ